MSTVATPIKVLYVVCVNPRNPIGGAEETLLEILRRTGEGSCVENLVVVSGEGAFTEVCRELGIVPILVPMQMPPSSSRPDIARVISFLLKGIASILRLARLIKQHQVDLVCTITRGAHIYGGIAGRLMRRRVMFHLHDIPQSRCATMLYFALIKHCAHRVVAVSQSIVDAYKLNWHDLSETKIAIVHNGIDLHRFSPARHAPDVLRERLELRERYPVVSIIGRVSRFKGLEEFIQAAKLVTDEFPHSRFLVVGQVWDEDRAWSERYDDLIRRLGLSDHILQLGQRSDVPDLIAASDIVVLASRFESFGLSIVQGMAMEKPIVATRCGGPEEIVVDGETGFLVPVQDPDELGAKILLLANDPHLAAQMGKAGRKRAEAEFDIERFVQRVVEIQSALVKEDAG